MYKRIRLVIVRLFFTYGSDCMVASFMEVGIEGFERRRKRSTPDSTSHSTCWPLRDLPTLGILGDDERPAAPPTHA